MTEALRWRHLWWLLWLFGMVLGCYLSLRPGSEKIPIIPHLDKLIHATSYALLAVMAVCLFTHGRRRWLALAWLVLFGGLIEIAQGQWAINRAADPWDLLANSLGIALGATVFWRRNLLAHIEALWPR